MFYSFPHFVSLVVIAVLEVLKLLRTLKYFLKGRGKGKTVVFIFQALIEIFLHLDFHGMEFPRKDMRISLRNPKEMGNHILLRIKGEKISSNVSFLHKPVKRLRDLLAKRFRTPWPFMSYLKIPFLRKSFMTCLFTFSFHRFFLHSHICMSLAWKKAKDPFGCIFYCVPRLVVYIV